MIKIHKDLAAIPNSLIARRTETRRNTCIRDARYHQEKEFNKRFKQEDVKTCLRRIYNKKCAYCEQKVVFGSVISDDKSTVEHYRPKSIYYWLAYSWDNLLWCCHRCNQNKDNDFQIMNGQVNYQATFLRNIHKSTSRYNTIENPSIVHPELEDIKSDLIFDIEGNVSSNDVRIQHTITRCGIDRYDLNEKRKKILDELKNKVNARKLSNNQYTDVVEEFVNNFHCKYNEFIAFRYWVLKNIQTLL